MKVKTKGDIKEKPVPEILLDSYIDGFEGVLRLRKDNIIKNIFFQMGLPIYATSNDKDDRLGAYLTRIGKISREDLTEALEISAEKGKKLGEVLIGEGKLEPEELVDVVVKQIEEIVYSTFEWTTGTYEFISEETIEEEDIIPLQMSVANIIMEGVRKRYPVEKLSLLIGGANTVLKLTNDPKYRFRELTLKKTEAQIISMVNGKRTVGEILKAFPDKKDIVYRTLGALLLMRTLEVVTKDESGEMDEVETERGIGEQRVEKKVEKKEPLKPVDPEKARKLFDLAKEFFKSGKQKEGLEFFKKSVELDPTKSEYYTGLGIALATDFPGHEAEPEEALRIFDRAIELNPEEARNYYYKGVIYKNLDKIDEARECFLKTLELNPDHKPAKMQLSNL